METGESMTALMPVKIINVILSAEHQLGAFT